MINIESLSVELGDFTLSDISLKIDDGEYFVILGPTGAGKTVLLESIAGLNPVKKGRIWLKDTDITGLKPEKRGVSIVYQDHALFPHLSVKDNILFGLRLQKKTPHELRVAQEWLSDLLDISQLLNRKPGTLSGGERQKVALARALSTRPDVLLLDEPISALDPETRESIREELIKLHRTLNNTIIHVTHDFEEAMSLGSRIAVIGEGKVKQIGTPEQIFHQPCSLFVAHFTLTRNVFSGEVTRDMQGNVVFHTKDIGMKVTAETAGTCYAAIRPEDIQISVLPFATATPNVFSGIVSGITDRGSFIAVIVTVPPDFTCILTRNQFMEMGLQIDKKVHVMIKPPLLHLFKEQALSLDTTVY